MYSVFLYFCSMKQITWVQRLQYFCLLLLSFVIPLNRRFFPPVFAVYVLLVLCEGSFKTKWRRMRERHYLLIFVGYLILYGSYVVGLLWSHNYPFAYRDLLLKLPFLLFPLCLFTSYECLFTYRRLLSLMYSFVSGCLLYSLYVCYVWIFKVGVNGLGSAFQISGSGYVMHHSYISMCYVLAVAIVFYLFLHERLKGWCKCLLALVAILLIFQIVVFSSRTAWIVSALLLLSFAVYLLVQTFRKRVRPYVSVLFFTMIVGTVLFVLCLPSNYNRCLQTFNNVKKEGTFRAADVRWSIWECSWDVIGEHPIFGVGTGDVRDSLTQKQIEAGLPSFNSHNQFLNTWVAVGIVGLLAFVMILVLSVRQAVRNRSFLYFVFIMIVVGNCMTEAILEKQTGLVFFVFFNTYLYCFVAENRTMIQKNDFCS